MGLRFINYGEDQWAVWSTNVDDWLVTGLEVDELIEWYTDRELRKARDRAINKISQIKNGENPYFGGMPPKESIEELEQGE